MGWSGRVPAPPVAQLASGAHDKEHPHVPARASPGNRHRYWLTVEASRPASYRLGMGSFARASSLIRAQTADMHKRSSRLPLSWLVSTSVQTTCISDSMPRRVRKKTVRHEALVHRRSRTPLGTRALRGAAISLNIWTLKCLDRARRPAPVSTETYC